MGEAPDDEGPATSPPRNASPPTTSPSASAAQPPPLILSERSESKGPLARSVGGLGLLLLGAWLALRVFGGGLAAALAEPSLNLIRAALGGAALGLLGLGALLGPGPSRWRLPPSLVLGGGLVWVALCAASAHWSVVPRSAWLQSVHALEDLLLLLAVWQVASTDAASARRLLAIFLACGVAAGALGVRERVWDRPQARAAYRADPTLGDVTPGLRPDLESRLFADQASGPFVLPNGLGAFCAAAALAALGAALATRGARRFLMVAACALSACGVWASAQKGGVVAAGLGLLVGAAWLARGRRPRAGRAALALALAGAIGLPLAILITPSSALERLPGGLSLAVRHEYAQAAARLAWEAPVRGVGAGQLVYHYGRVRPLRSESTRLSHDEWLEALLETGPLGLAAFCALWVGLLASAWRSAPGTEPKPEDPSPRGAGQTVPLYVGLGVGAALLVALGLPYRSPTTALPLALGLPALAAGLAWCLAAARGPWIWAGAVAALGSILAQAGFDFVLHEPGIAGAGLLLAGALAASPVGAGLLGSRASRGATAAVVALGLATAVGLDLFALAPQLEREALRQQAESAAARHDTADAEQAWAKLLAGDPRDARAAAALAELYAGRWEARHDRADLDAALGGLRRLTESPRADLAELWTRRGELLLRAGRPDEAVRVLQRGVARSPVAAHLRLALARALARAGRAEEAGREARRALERSEATRSAAGRLRAEEVAEARRLARRG